MCINSFLTDKDLGWVCAPGWLAGVFYVDIGSLSFGETIFYS